MEDTATHESSGENTSPAPQVLAGLRNALLHIQQQHPEYNSITLPDTLLDSHRVSMLWKLAPMIMDYPTRAQPASIQDLLNQASLVSNQPTLPMEVDPLDRSQANLRFERWQTAWKLPFKRHFAFSQYLSHLAQIGSNRTAGGKLYSRVFPLIQSSGTGKSRMLDESASYLLTIPVCLRSKDGEGKENGYPPGDSAVFTYLCVKVPVGQSRVARLLHFLIAAFEACFRIVSSLKDSGCESMVTGWKKWLEEGDNRANFYDGVIQTAKSRNQDLNTYNQTDTKQYLLDITSAQSNILKLSQVVSSRVEDQSLIQIYFDEAHELEHGVGVSTLFSVFANINGRNPPPHIVIIATDQSTILPELSSLANNPNMNSPPPGGFRWTEAKPYQLPQPWTFTPRHVFLRSPDAAGDTPQNVRAFPHAATFGRPLWSSYLQALDGSCDDTAHEMVVELACAKLCNEGAPNTDEATKAALICRLGLVINTTAAGGTFTRTMVGKHAATALYIPQLRDFVVAAYAIEPVLGHASAYIIQLNSKKLVRCLESLLSSSQIGRGIRGELLSKFMLMRAYDLSHAAKSPLSDNLQAPVAEATPLTAVTLEAFLISLVGQQPALDILESTPWNQRQTGNNDKLRNYSGSKTILSQWTSAARISDIESLEGLRTAVHYQCGVEGSTNMPIIDGFLVFTLQDDKVISPHNLLVFCYQTKTRKVKTNLPPHYDSVIGTWLEMGVTVIYLLHNVVRPGDCTVETKGQSPDDKQPGPTPRSSSQNKKTPLYYFVLNGINASIIEPHEVELLAHVDPLAYADTGHHSIRDLPHFLPKMELMDTLEATVESGIAPSALKPPAESTKKARTK